MRGLFRASSFFRESAKETPIRDFCLLHIHMRCERNTVLLAGIRIAYLCAAMMWNPQNNSTSSPSPTAGHE
jgi:hypothetical protein